MERFFECECIPSLTPLLNDRPWREATIKSSILTNFMENAIVSCVLDGKNVADESFLIYFIIRISSNMFHQKAWKKHQQKKTVGAHNCCFCWLWADHEFEENFKSCRSFAWKPIVFSISITNIKVFLETFAWIRIKYKHLLIMVTYYTPSNQKYIIYYCHT